MGLCNLALHQAINKVIENAPYMKYDKATNFIEIKLGGDINEHNINGIAHTTATTLNSSINNGVKDLGNVFQATDPKEIIQGVRVRMTTKQLALLDADDENTIVELQKEVDEENTRREQEIRDKEIKGEEEFLQKKEVEQSQASPETIKVIKDFLDRIGVDVKSLEKIVVNGVKQDANGVALIMQKLIQVVNGKEASALPEEAMHFAIELIEQNNPTLFNLLLKEINDYNLYKEVLKTYSGVYTTKDGKPDIRKIKKEAIAKVLAETVIKNAEGLTERPELLAKTQSWWQKIIEFFKGLFSKSGFDQAAMDFLSGKDLGELKSIEEVYYQRASQEDVYNKIKNFSNTIEKREDGYYIDGKKVPRRVTDDVKDWYGRKFKNNDLVKDEYEKAVDDLKAEKGTAGHADLEHILNVYVNENGLLRNEPLDDSGYVSQINPKNRDMYDLLKSNMKDRLYSYPEGTRFMSEVTVYSGKKRMAGTIDFLAITPDGKVNILDWKFMNLNIEKTTDIPWYKRDAWRVQMGQYKAILEESYGLRNEDFGQTRMIPILAEYTKGNKKDNVLPELIRVKIGSVNLKNVEEDYLLPLGLETEKTGNRKIDVLIEKLNADYKKYSEETVAPDKKSEKAEHLNALFRAIRQLQVRQNIQPLLYEAKVLNKQINNLIEEYKNKYEGKDGSQFSEQDKSDFADKLDALQESLLIYTDIDIYLRTLFQGELSEEDKKLREDLRDTAEAARDLEADLNETIQDFAANIIVKGEGIENFLNPEKIVKGLSRLFSSTATIQTKAIQFLYKKANKAYAYIGIDTLEENKKLLSLKETYQEWAKGKGLTNKNYFDSIKKKDSNELIDKFDKDFYKELKTKIENKDFKWIRENINVSEYNEYLKEKLRIELERLDNTLITGSEEEMKAKRAEIKFKKDKLTNLYNTSTTESAGWLMYDYIKLFPKDKWYSKEWQELIKSDNKAAKDFYDYIVEKNTDYRALGYINSSEARTFLPYVRKSLTEKLITGGDIRLGEQFFQSISLDEGDIGYGKIDPHTGKPLNVIPKYFTNEIEGELSEDLFRNMSLYNEAALRYKYLSEVEDQVRLVLKVEQNKKAIATSRFGKTEYKDGVLQYTPNNAENSKLYEDMMKSIIYGQKFIESETFDQLLGKLGTWGEKFNEKLGMKVFPENLSERQMSVNKMIDGLNGIFQMNTLGLNLLSAGSNLFGGNSHSLINAGKYFTKKDYLKAELMLFTNKFNGEDAKKMLAALEYFLPLTDNYNREIAKKLSVNTLTDESLQDGLMSLMRYSDLNVQTSNFYAYLFNTIVDEGQIKNVREYLKSTEKYSSMYSVPKEERDKLNEEFEEDVKKLVEEKGVLKVGSVVDDKLVIPGVDNKSLSVVELRRKVQQISKNALGNLTADDVRTINMTVYGKSFMVFKNWIPRLVDVRMGNLKYNSASDAYEWGRMRTIFRILSDDLLHSVGNLKNSLIANEKGVDYLKELYEKKRSDYENDTGKQLEMTEDEFIDLVRQNIKSQIIDTVFLLTLCGLIYALKAFAPDDDEDPAVKSQYRFILKATDKFRDELMYFYNPTSLSGLVSTGIFPAVAFVTNFEKATVNFFKENWALATGDEELVKKNQVIKYWMKTFPFTNQIVGYLPMFYPEVAKDLGVKIQSNYGIR